MTKVLVTGAEGFVGQHLLKDIVQEYKVIGLVFDKTSDTYKHKNIEYVKADVLKKESLFSPISQYKPDIIVHLAAKSTTWLEDVQSLFQTNLFGTINLYDCVVKLKKKGQYNPKIISVSSAEAYGLTPNPENITEDSPLYPVTYYAASKAAADRTSFSYSQTAGLNIVIVRPFPHTGPGQKKGFFVPDMASQIAELEKSLDKNSVFVGNLEAVRDYLDVRDVVGAYKLMFKAEFPRGDCYNICSGRGVKMKDLLDILLSKAKIKIKVKRDPKRLRPIDVPRYIGNNDKIRKALGWEPKINITKTLEDTLNYWRALLPTNFKNSS